MDDRPRYIGIDQIDADEFMRVILDLVGFSDSPEGMKSRVYLELDNETQDKRFGRVETETPLILTINDDSIDSVDEALRFHQKAERVSRKSEFILGNKDSEETHTAAEMKSLPRYPYTRSLKFVFEGAEAPKYMIIGLKRTQVSYGRHGRWITEKLNKRVQVDPFTPLLVDFYEVNRKVTRSMLPTAIVMQSGFSSEGGHFTALIKNQENGNWVLHDDTRVKTVNIMQVLEGREGVNRNAYVIIYSAVGAKSVGSGS